MWNALRRLTQDVAKVFPHVAHCCLARDHELTVAGGLACAQRGSAGREGGSQKAYSHSPRGRMHATHVRTAELRA